MTHQKEYRDTHKGEQQSDVMKALSKQWSLIKGTDQAAPYQALADKDKARYEAENAAYEAANGIVRKAKQTKKPKPAPTATATAPIVSAPAAAAPDTNPIPSESQLISAQA